MDENLFNEHKGLIYYVIKKLGLQYNFEECYDVGELALIKAIKTYEDRGCKFSSYATNCIKYDIYKYLLYKSREKRKCDYMSISLDEEIADNLTLLDVIDSGINLEEDILKQERINLLNTIIEILEPRDRFMLKHYYELGGFEKLTYKQIGDRLGLKQRYVEYRVKRALRIIKKIMQDKEE